MVALLLTVLLLPMVNGADSTVSTNTTWSGDMVLTGNVTVASGATLTVSPGTTVDARDYAIIVEGALMAEQVTFYSSIVPETQGSHGQGLWPGIVVEVGGQANLTETTVANASAGVLVRGDFNGTDVVFNDAYRGLSVVGGEAVITGFEANRMDYEAVYVETGILDFTDGTATEVAVGLANHDTATVAEFTVYEAGVGVQSYDGTLDMTDIGVYNASVGFATASGASSLVHTFTGTGLALAIDAGDADDFVVHTAQLTGERMVVGQGVSSMHLEAVEFTSASSDELRPAFDIRCDGVCTLENSVIDGQPRVGVSWSGTGTSEMQNVSVFAAEQAVGATGSGHTAWTNVTVNASQTGVSVQTPTSALSNVQIELTSSDGVGLDVLGGVHDWDDITVEKAFASTDQTSIGLKAWYSDLSIGHFTSRNVSTGMMLEDSSVVALTAEANIGSLAGLHLIDSSYRGSSLTTIAQDEGVLMEGDTALHLSSWTAQLHNTPLMMSSGSTATVRSFTLLNTAQTSADALGDGTFYYGSSYNPSISTSASYRFIETDVTFTDLTGQPVEAHVSVHGFALMSNSNGALTLPLVSTGSVVDVTLEGAGARVTLFGGKLVSRFRCPLSLKATGRSHRGKTSFSGPGRTGNLTNSRVI